MGRNLEMTNDELKFPLKERKCAPCERGISPLKGRLLSEFLANLSIDWSLTHDDRLRKIYKFRDFKSAMEFANKVGDLAEAEGHHPEICIKWGEVKIVLWTHAAGGLTENDFILAAKISELD